MSNKRAPARMLTCPLRPRRIGPFFAVKEAVSPFDTESLLLEDSTSLFSSEVTLIYALPSYRLAAVAHPRHVASFRRKSRESKQVHSRGMIGAAGSLCVMPFDPQQFYRIVVFDAKQNHADAKLAVVVGKRADLGNSHD